MINKLFCLSSYFAYRYIFKDGIDFYPGMEHVNFKPIALNQRIKVNKASEIDAEIKRQFNKLYQQYNNIGILLSGGMDSAILASYLRPGSHAYTFTTQDSAVFNDDLQRAQYYCKKFNLIHHQVNISFDDYSTYTPIVMRAKGAPVHSIEPQIYKAAIEAKRDGVELMIVGESADLIFGGMNQLIGEDWNFDDFVKRYTFLDPNRVLREPDNKVFDLYDTYRKEEGKIDFLKFMDEVFSIESSSSYLNAFGTAQMPYYDPYACLVMGQPLDLKRVRNGEPKYLIRELYALKYPEREIPFKIPMPRPVDAFLQNWSGPKRQEFREDIDMNKLTGNQKWQLWCAELFLNLFDQQNIDAR